MKRLLTLYILFLSLSAFGDTNYKIHILSKINNKLPQLQKSVNIKNNDKCSLILLIEKTDSKANFILSQNNFYVSPDLFGLAGF